MRAYGVILVGHRWMPPAFLGSPARIFAEPAAKTVGIEQFRPPKGFVSQIYSVHSIVGGGG